MNKQWIVANSENNFSSSLCIEEISCNEQSHAPKLNEHTFFAKKIRHPEPVNRILGKLLTEKPTTFEHG